MAQRARKIKMAPTRRIDESPTEETLLHEVVVVLLQRDLDEVLARRRVVVVA